MGEFHLVLGGARSGKTGLTLKMCEAHSGPRLYLATAQARDPEMDERIQRHRAERGPEWRTVEEPLDPAGVLAGLTTASATVVLLDCLTLWLSNLLTIKNLTPEEISPMVGELARTAREAPCPVYLVGNEVGWGIVPDNQLARTFRDVAGAAHQLLAREAATVTLVVAGLEWRLKG